MSGCANKRSRSTYIHPRFIAEYDSNLYDCMRMYSKYTTKFRALAQNEEPKKKDFCTTHRGCVPQNSNSRRIPRNWSLERSWRRI